MRPFFIVGCPRSGTTLLQQILLRHPEIVIPPETAFFTKVVSPAGRVRRRGLEQLETDLEITLPLPGRLDRTGTTRAYEAMATAYAERVGRPDATWFGEKTPDHLGELDRIVEALPEARIVVLHRDGRDVAVSLTKVPWSPADPTVNFGIWRRSAQRLERWLAATPAPTLVVRYEALARAPEVEVRRVTDFLELDFDDAMLTADSPLQGIPQWEMGWKARATEPVRTDRIGVWRRELSSGVVRTMERWGGRELTRLGYEITEPPDTAPSPAALAATYVRWGAWRAAALVRQISGAS